MPMIDLDNYTPAYAREHWGVQLNQYTPPADSVIIDVDVDFVTRPITPPIHLVQYDKVLPVLAIHMYSNRSAYSMPQQSTAAIRVNLGNGAHYYAFAEGRSADFTIVYFVLQAPLCYNPGFKPGVIEISNSEGLINSSAISIEVEQNPMPEDAIHTDEDYINLINIIHGVEKWAYGDCQHLTNNSWIVNGCKDGVQIGTGATAEGAENTSTGAYSHTEGYNNTASGACAHAEGNNSTASALGSHAEGSSSATSSNAHAEGSGTTASGSDAHSEGNATTASGGYSHAEGNGTTASGSKAHAEGDTTVASEPSAHAEGIHSEASNRAAHAEGNYTTASGESSHSEGDHATASGDYSHAEGYHTTASGDYSHAEGGSNTASGVASHAEGISVTASGQASHASGTGTVAGYENQVAIGEYNENKQSDVFEIGNGTSTTRKNIFSISKNGDILTRRQFSTLVSSELGLEYSFKQVMETMVFGTYHSYPAYRNPSALTATLKPTAAIPAGSYGTFRGIIQIPFTTFDVGPLTMLADGNSMGFSIENLEINEWVNVSTGSDRDISLLTTEYTRTVTTPGVIDVNLTCNVHNNSTKQVPTTVEMRMSLNCAIMYMLKQS